ncbi:hypothetical protein CWI36_2584p0010, partial [Hamiltosporidium magnivora]
CKNRQEKEILTPYLKPGQYPAEYSKEGKRLFRQKAEHFTLLGDDICFKRRDHLIRAVFGFETASIKQIIQTEHAVAHIEVNKMMAFITMVPAIYIDPDMVLVEENTADTQWILEIASDLYEEFTETVTTTTTIITDEFEIDSKIRTDV